MVKAMKIKVNMKLKTTKNKVALAPTPLDLKGFMKNISNEDFDSPPNFLAKVRFEPMPLLSSSSKKEEAKYYDCAPSAFIWSLQSSVRPVPTKLVWSARDQHISTCLSAAIARHAHPRTPSAWHGNAILGLRTIAGLSLLLQERPCRP